MNNVNKWTVIMVAAVVAIVAILFLPIASETATDGRQSLSVTVSGLDLINGEATIEASNGETGKMAIKAGADMYVIFAAAAVAIFAGWKKNHKFAMTAGSIGAALSLVNAIISDKLLPITEEAKASGVTTSTGILFGFWVAAVCFAAIIYLAWVLKKEDSQQDAPVEISQQ